MYEKRVARGAKWMDKVCPDWYNLVNTDTLSLTLRGCVIGQSFAGNFDNVMNEKFFIPAGLVNTRKIYLHPGVYVGVVWTLRNGFGIGRAYGEPAWRKAWVNEIEKRRDADRKIYVPAEWEEKSPVLS